MISLVTALWIMVGLFGVIATQRGWTREVIATAGLILSLFTINQFGPLLFNLLGDYGQPFTADIWRRQFYILTSIHLLIAFFSFAGPALAGNRLSGRLRVRDNVQDKLLGLIVGALNGFLVVGTLLSFLQFRLTTEGWLPTAPEPYPFPAEVLVRTGQVAEIAEYLPIPLLTQNPLILPVLLVLIFLFVLVVML